MDLSLLILSKKWSKIPERIALYPTEVQCYHDGNLPIHLACRNASVPVNIIKCLIEDFPESLKIGSTSFGQIPLHCAVCTHYPNANVNVIQVLLENYKEGASVKSNYGHLPLYDYLLTCYQPTFDIVQKLVEAYPNAVCINDEICMKKFYPLHCAAIRSNCDIVEYLIHIYPDALVKKTGDGRKAQDIAHHYYNTMVEKLLREETKKRYGDVKGSKGNDKLTLSSDETNLKPNFNNDDIIEERIFLDKGNVNGGIVVEKNEAKEQNNDNVVVEDKLNINGGKLR